MCICTAVRFAQSYQRELHRGDHGHLMEDAEGVVVQVQHSLFGGDRDLDVSAHQRKTLILFQCNAGLLIDRTQVNNTHIFSYRSR